MRYTTIDPTTVSREIEESVALTPRLEVDEGHRTGGVTAQQASHPSVHTAPSSSRVVEGMDRAVGRVLHVQPQLMNAGVI
jgi:hypothetical protein